MAVSRIGGQAIAFALAMSVGAAAASANPVADFYRSKNLTVLVGSDAGGGYDTYARALAPFWRKHIPGNPSIAVKNMPGAGGVKMQNFIANQAARDGSVVGATRAIFLVEPLLYGNRLTRYDPQKMNWIGNISAQQTGCFVSSSSPIKTIQDAMHKQVRIGMTSVVSNGAVIAHVFNALAGTKFKVIPGYKSKGIYLAIQRGEIDGSCLSYATVSAAAPGLIESGKLKFLAFEGLNRNPHRPNVPVLGELLKNPKDIGVVRLIMASLIMGRPYVAPEGIPQDRLAALRTSFMATMKDPAFLAQAKKEHLLVAPSDHREIEKIIADAYKIPKATVERTRHIIAEARRR